MGTPGDRIVEELEKLPPRDRMNTVVEVMQRLGMTTPARHALLSETGKLWVAVGATALSIGIGIMIAMAIFPKPPPQGWLDLTTTPFDADVFLDGRAVGELPGPWIQRSAGRHLLTVSRRGYIPNDQTIVISANRALRIEVTLQPSPGSGFEITSEPPGLIVSIDGRSIYGPSRAARTPFRAERIEPGTHRVDLFKDGTGIVWSQDVLVEGDRIVPVHAIVAR